MLLGIPMTAAARSELLYFFNGLLTRLHDWHMHAHTQSPCIVCCAFVARTNVGAIEEHHAPTSVHKRAQGH